MCETRGTAVQSLDGLWDRYRGPWRRLLSKNAIAELKLRASFDLDLLAPTRLLNTIPTGTIPDCEACQDICCAGVENVVSLRLKDIATLIDIEKTELISRKKPRFPGAMLFTRPALQELVDSELWRALPVLKQIGDYRICAALTPEMRCSLYPNWPLSCERFPYSLVAARRRVIWGSRCASRKTDPAHSGRREEMFRAAVDTFNERVRDAVLIAHARSDLDEIGIGEFVTDPREEFLEASTTGRLPIL